MKYLLAQECQYHQINGEPCLINREGDFASFNEAGSHIISSIYNEARLDEMTRELQTKYNLDADKLREDIHSFLLHLVDNGFLTISSNE